MEKLQTTDHHPSPELDESSEAPLQEMPEESDNTVRPANPKAEATPEHLLDPFWDDVRGPDIEEGRKIAQQRQENLRNEIKQRQLDLMSDPNAILGQDIVEKELESAPEITGEKAKEMSKAVGEAVDKAPTSVKIAANFAGLIPEMVEDIQNTGIDIVNGVTSLFGEGTNIEQMDLVSNALPSDKASEITRDISKFLIGYSAILKGINTTTSLSKTKYGARAADAIAGMGADFVLLSPEQKAFTHQALKKLPIASTLLEYIDNPDDSNLEKRMKNAVFGIVDGQIANLFIKAISLGAKWSGFDKFLADPSSGVGFGKRAEVARGGDIDMTANGRVLKFAPKTEEVASDPLVAKIKAIQEGKESPLTKDEFIDFVTKNIVTDDTLTIEGKTGKDFLDVQKATLEKYREFLKENPVLSEEASEQIESSIRQLTVTSLITARKNVTELKHLLEDMAEASPEAAEELFSKVEALIPKDMVEGFKDIMNIVNDINNNIVTVSPKAFEKSGPKLKGKPKLRLAGDDVSDIPKIADEADLASKEGTDAKFIPEEAGQKADNVIQIAQTESYKKRGFNAIEHKTPDGKRIFMNLRQMRQNLHKFIRETVEADKESFARDIVSDDEMMEISKFYDKSPREIEEWARENGLKQGMILAATRSANTATEAAMNAAKLYNKGEMSKEIFVEHLADAKDILHTMQNMKSMAGLLLREASIIPETAQAATRRRKELQELIQIFGEDAERIAQELAKGGMTAAGFRASLNNYFMPTANFLTQMRFASMLSNPATHARNMFTGGQNAGLLTGETFLAATFRAMKAPRNKFTRDPYGVFFSDAWYQTLGLAKGTIEAMMITSTKIGLDVKKILPEGTIPPTWETQKFWGVNPNRSKIPYAQKQVQQGENKSLIGKSFQFLGDMINDPLRTFPNFVLEHGIKGQFVTDLLRFEDNFMKHAFARATLQREAHKLARIQRSVHKKSREEANEFLAEMLANPNGDIMKKMYAEAEYQTLTNPPPISDYFKDTLNNPIVKLVVPFSHVNINQMAYRFERIPGFNMIMKRSQEQWFSKDPAVRDQFLGKMAFSTSVLTSLGFWLHGEDRITGRLPLDSKRRAMYEQAGRLSGAARFKNEWIEYRSETPFGKLLMTVANISSLIDAVDGQDDKLVNDIGLAMTMLVTDIFNPDFITENVAKLGEALFADSPAQARKLVVFGGSVGSQFFPMTGAARAYTRTFTDAGKIKREAYDPTSMFDTFWNSIFRIYAPEMLEPKRNILGEPIMHKEGLGPDIISPFGVGKQTEDPVIQELAKVSGANHTVIPDDRIDLEMEGFTVQGDYVTIQMPPRVMAVRTGEGGRSATKKLRPAEYSRFVQATAGINPDTGEAIGSATLKEALQIAINTDVYKSEDTPQYIKGLLLRNIIEEYRKVGKAWYFKEAGWKQALEKLGEKMRQEFRDAEMDARANKIIEENDDGVNLVEPSVDINSVSP